MLRRFLLRTFSVAMALSIATFTIAIPAPAEAGVKETIQQVKENTKALWVNTKVTVKGWWQKSEEKLRQWYHKAKEKSQQGYAWMKSKLRPQKAPPPPSSEDVAASASQETGGVGDEPIATVKETLVERTEEVVMEAGAEPASSKAETEIQKVSRVRIFAPLWEEVKVLSESPGIGRVKSVPASLALTEQQEALRSLLEKSRFGELPFFKAQYFQVRDVNRLETLIWSWGTAAESLWQILVDRNFSTGSVFDPIDFEREDPKALRRAAQNVADLMVSFFQIVFSEAEIEQLQPLVGENPMIEVYSRKQDFSDRALGEGTQGQEFGQMGGRTYSHPLYFTSIYLDPFGRRLIFSSNREENLPRIAKTQWLPLVRELTGQMEWDPGMFKKESKLNLWVEWTPATRKELLPMAKSDPASYEPIGSFQLFDSHSISFDVSDISPNMLSALLHVLIKRAEETVITPEEIALGRKKFGPASSNDSCEEKL